MQEEHESRVSRCWSLSSYSLRVSRGAYERGGKQQKGRAMARPPSFACFRAGDPLFFTRAQPSRAPVPEEPFTHPTRRYAPP